MLAFCVCKSYENYVVKKKTENEKDNVIEFVSIPGESAEALENEGLEEADIFVETSGEGINGEDEELSELEVLLREKEKYYDLMLRKQAELENYRKRAFRDKEEAVSLARISLLQDILPIVDACEKGLENLRNEEQGRLLGSYAEGYELLLKQLKSFLEKNNVSAVTGVGSIFNPNIHEAVLREVSEDHEDGKILEEYRRGYKMNNLLLRAAQVKVAVHPD